MRKLTSLGEIPNAAFRDDEPLFGGTPFRDAHTEDRTDDQVDTKQYYSILNVDQDASDEQIRDAYKTLAVAFHPDKHVDSKHKTMAEQSFRDIQKAYEVLSNPEQRAVYDHLGEAGLKSSWSLTVPGQSPAELRAEMERQARIRQAADAEALVKSRGEFAATIDASSLFAPAVQKPIISPLAPPRIVAPPSLSDRLEKVNCTQLIGKHSFETQTSNTTAISISGQMMSRGGMGGGNLIGTVKTHWSPKFFSEVSATLLKPHILTSKGQYSVDDHLFFTYAIVSQTLAVPPSLTVTWGQRLSHQSSLTGFSSYKTGAYTIGPWGANQNGDAIAQDTGALIVGVTKQEPLMPGWTFQTTLSEMDLSVGYDWSMRVLGGILIRSGIVLGTGSGFSLFTNGERRLTENIRVMIGMECGLLSGVQAKVRVSRLGQRIVVPIMLSPTFRADLAGAATLLPAAIFAISHYLYFVPRRQRLQADRLAKLRQSNVEAIEQRRGSAEQTRELLRAQAWKRAEIEFQRKGVVIVQAYYGEKAKFPAALALSRELCEDQAELMKIAQRPDDVAHDVFSENQPLWWDVRVPLQMLVNQSQLVIPAGRSKVCDEYLR
ncbi:hypothetical protein MPSI1_004046 [Malassezia psittaci]|uniref:J domain-containing protein n=1 Tax=Malassezia psittaci TaxID=1821823 RepID=A0AAF0FF46_9BASI|nr:hypothetical protein MPSI1_004046 [Malassezia psittaci]